MLQLSVQVKGCVFENWERNFERLEDVILSSLEAGEPSPLAPIQVPQEPVSIPSAPIPALRTPCVVVYVLQRLRQTFLQYLTRFHCIQCAFIMKSLFPLQATMYPLAPRVALAICTQLGAQAAAAARTALPAALPLPPAPTAAAVLRVAYVTSHFTSSSIGREMLFLIGAHDRARVAPFCYALNKDEGLRSQALAETHHPCTKLATRTTIT